MSETSNTTTDLIETTHTTASAAATQSAGLQESADDRTSVETTQRPTEQNQDSFSYENVRLAQDVSLGAKDWDEFKALARELKLSEEQVQRLADFESACAKRKAEQAVTRKHQQTTAWANETRALYGAGLEQEITFALRAANAFGGQELRALLEETGLGNHPVIIRTLSGIGRTISEDACPGGNPAAPQDKTFAEALYGKRN